MQSLPMRTLPLAQRASGRSAGGRATKAAGSTGRSLVVSRDVCNVKTTARGAIATARHERADLQRRYCIIFPAVRPILRHG